MFQELIWFRRLCQSVNGVSDAVIKENVSLLFSWPFSNNIALKSKPVQWGKKCFGWACRALLAVSFLHLCSECLMLQLLGSTDGTSSNRGRGASCEILQPWSHQLCHRLCQRSCGSLSWAPNTAGFLNDTQASCVIWKLSHFLPFHKKIQHWYWILEIGMMYPKQFWCVSSVCCVGGCAAMHVTVSSMKSGNGGILPSLEQDFNA